LKNAYLPRCAGSFPGIRRGRLAAYGKVRLIPQALRALQLSIPYHVRDKLLNSLQNRVFFQHPAKQEEENDGGIYQYWNDYSSVFGFRLTAGR
jgi:hypothetical protein